MLEKGVSYLDLLLAIVISSISLSALHELEWKFMHRLAADLIRMEADNVEINFTHEDLAEKCSSMQSPLFSGLRCLKNTHQKVILTTP